MKNSTNNQNKRLEADDQTQNIEIDSNAVKTDINPNLENTQSAEPQNDYSLQVAEKEKKRRDFILNGNLWKVVLLISLPLMMMNAFNFLYNILDTIFASQINKDAISAVVILNQINNMIASLGTGLASGGMIIISRLIGRKDYQRAKKMANTMLCLAVIVAATMLSIVIPLTVPILKLSQTPDELIAIGTKYFIIQSINAGVTLFNGIFLGLEKTRGKTTNVLIFNLSVAAIKIALSASFIYGFHITDLAIIALSTLIANLMLTVFIIIRLAMPTYLFRFSFKNKDFSRKTFKSIATISFPIFLGRFVFSLGKVIVNSMASVYGKDAAGALGVSNNLGGTVTNILGSVEDSTSLIISTNLGQKNLKRALKAFYLSFLLNIGLAGVGIALVSIFNDPLISFFANGDAQYAAMISKIFAYEKMGIIALGINSAVLGLLYGYGYTKMSMFINLSRLFVFRIPSLLIMINLTNIGFESVGIAMLISNAGIGLMSIVIGIIYLIKIKKRNLTDELKI